MNTGIPDGRALGDGFMQWRRYAQRQRQLDAGGIVQSVLTMRTLTDAEVDAYRAPFPSPVYQAGALAFPAPRPDPAGSSRSLRESDRHRESQAARTAGIAALG
jgi:hypothetical protein